MAIMNFVSRAVFALVSAILMLLAGSVIVYGAVQVAKSFYTVDADPRGALLDGVGYTIIAVAIFDVARYLIEEEVVRARELRHPGEARRSLTKFLSTITIAVFLEAIVLVFEATGEAARQLIYPTFLLLGGVALIVGLGAYQRLSTSAEKEMGGIQGEMRDERAEERKNEDSNGQR